MYEYDVVVVGAGNAALAAAVSACEHGLKRVLVLEKAPRSMRGGNTHWSGGALRFAIDEPSEIAPLVEHLGGRIDDFVAGVSPYPESMYTADLAEVTSGRTDPELSATLVSQSKSTVFWMHDVAKIKMEPAVTTGVRKGNIIVWAPGYALRAEHEGVGLSRSWFAAAERMGAEIRYGSAAVDLVVDGSGRVSAVKVRDEDGFKEISTKSVILACGGFEANAQMRTQHLGPHLGQAKVRGTPYNQGDGLRMAMAIGAMPWGQWSGCHSTPISADWGDFAPREMTDRSNRLSYTLGVMLNRKGHRFVDEGEHLRSYTYAKFGREILAQPGAKAWQIFDQKVLHLLEPRYSTSKPIVGETLEALIAQLDIDNKQQALETLREYNAAARYAAEGFDPTKRDKLSTKGLALEKTNWALKLDTPPYHAYSATGGITFSFGGLRVDKEAQVIGTDWRKIDGLYACGEMIGGLFYDNYPAGTGLVSGATFGRIAGRNAAAEAA